MPRPAPTPRKILIFATGSVATIKLPLLISQLSSQGHNIRVILTPSASRFLHSSTTIPPHIPVYGNEDEWSTPWTRGDPVLHIELRKWADLLLIAPLSANTLAKMASGLCDGLGLSVVRAWDTGRGPGDEGKSRRRRILVAPAMNTHMWLHPLTESHLSILRGWEWVQVLEPVSKLLACGDMGVGGMMEVEDIVREVHNVLVGLDLETSSGDVVQDGESR
ncbi:flavo protein [Ascodesmis nigricans]|uniref:Flavo protein n=1 Tax=Ascodesmis nigricans TaxID=341454 RepID=A0A4S2N646_9PEZI|nr:flavo protein [Ascodesmis nigricans]